MKMKKLMSAALAGALALSLSVPAFAADTEVGMDGLSEGAIVEVTGTTQTATVKILVPATGDIILNPYKLDYKATADATAVQDQIISATQYIVNESNLPVKVSTKVTGTIEGADFIATTAIAETTKKVNLKFGIGATSAKDTEPTSFEEKALAKTETAFTDITMGKKGGTNPAVGYKFSGDASKNPDTPWTTDDIVGATIAFTFKLEGGSSTPTPPSAGDASVTVAISGNTATATFSAGTSGLTATSYAWTNGTDATATIDTTSTTNSTTITDVSSTSGDSTIITVVVTLSNGATVTGTATYTIA